MSGGPSVDTVRNHGESNRKVRTRFYLILTVRHRETAGYGKSYQLCGRR